MSTPFLGEIRVFAFQFAPKGYALCDGQLLAIQQNQALFAILGTTYGGNGTTTFALPDLRSRTPIHVSNGFTLGQQGGEENHTLNTSEMPAHTHPVAAVDARAQMNSPGGNLWAARLAPFPYGNNNDTTMSGSAVGTAGGGQPHPNLQPLLVINFTIALLGIFPSRN